MTSKITDFQRDLIDSTENMKQWQRERAVLAVTEMICEIMEDENISRTALAELMGVGKSNVTQLLDNANLQVNSIADMCTAMGYEFIPAAKKLSGENAEAPSIIRMYEMKIPIAGGNKSASASVRPTKNFSSFNSSTQTVKLAQ